VVDPVAQLASKYGHVGIVGRVWWTGHKCLWTKLQPSFICFYLQTCMTRWHLFLFQLPQPVVILFIAIAVLPLL